MKTRDMALRVAAGFVAGRSVTLRAASSKDAEQIVEALTEMELDYEQAGREFTIRIDPKGIQSRQLSYLLSTHHVKYVGI